MSARGDHQQFLGFRKELAFGLRDGVLVSIADVTRGAACRCICPACDAALIARKGDILIHHFAHAGSADGCGAGVETNAHLWAKRELEAALWIRLPPLKAEAAGLSHTIHPGRDFQFAKAELEKHAGEIVPDVQLTAPDGRQLIVEVYVTHKCGPEKIARIREGRVSAIEVDLSKWRRSNDADKIAEALLTTAPRTWLFNPAIDKAEAQLEERAAELARAEAARRLKRATDEVSRVRRAPVRKPAELERLRATLQAVGHGHLLVGAQPGDGFVVPARLWKAAALGRLIREAPAYGACGQVTTERLIDLVQDCLFKDDRPRKQRLSQKDLKAAVPSYRSPDEAMEAFVEALHEARVLYYRKGDLWLQPGVVEAARALTAKRKREAEAEQARAGRSAEARAQLDRLFALAQAPTETTVFSLAAWERNLRSAPGQSLADLVQTGDDDWRRLTQQLSAIERMLDGGVPTDELLGLPFEDALNEARAQAVAIAASEQAAAEAAARAAHLERRETVRAEAAVGLGGEAAGWLDEQWEGGGSRLEVAAGSVEGLNAIRSALRTRIAALAEEARRAAEIEALRQVLRRAAGTAYEPDHAALFLNSGRRELDLKSPLAVCVDQHSLERCLRLLPNVRLRR